MGSNEGGVRATGSPTHSNFLRRLALPRSICHWSLTTLREKLIKIGAKVVRHARYVTFQAGIGQILAARGQSEISHGLGPVAERSI